MKYLVTVFILILLAYTAQASSVRSQAAVAVAFAFAQKPAEALPKPRVDCQCPDGCKCSGTQGGPCECSTQRRGTSCSPECCCGCNEGKPCRCGDSDTVPGATAVKYLIPAVRSAPIHRYYQTPKIQQQRYTPQYRVPLVRPLIRPMMAPAARSC